MLNFIQRGMQRRQIGIVLDDSDLKSHLVWPIHRQLLKMYAGMDEPTMVLAMAGTNLDVLALQLGTSLHANEGQDKTTVTSGSFLTILQQIIQMLLGMFTGGCVPTPTPTPPTPAQVLAALQ